MDRSSKALLALAALGSVSCADSGHAQTAGTDFCVTWLAAEVQHEAACERASASWIEHRIADLPKSCALITRSLSAGGLRYDPAMGAACVQWLEATYAAAPCNAAPPAEPESCNQAFRPQVAAGGSCTESADCIDGWCSYPEGSCPRPGECIALGGEGAACDPSPPFPPALPSCQPGYQCDWTAETDYTCRVPAAPGGEVSRCGYGLSPGAMCPEGLVCAGGRGCARFVGEGSRCDEAGSLCGGGLFCNDAGACEAYPELGDACSPERGCLDGFCSSLDSRCHPIGETGDPCSETEPCSADTHTCVDGICQPVCPGW